MMDTITRVTADEFDRRLREELDAVGAFGLPPDADLNTRIMHQLLVSRTGYDYFEQQKDAAVIAVSQTNPGTSERIKELHEATLKEGKSQRLELQASGPYKLFMSTRQPVARLDQEALTAALRAEKLDEEAITRVIANSTKLTKVPTFYEAQRIDD